MLNAKIAKQGLLFAGLSVLYVAIVAVVMTNAPRIFGSQMTGLLAPIGFLLLFVVSAAMMGLLIFGKPVMLYLDGQKREAVALLGCTIGSLAIITVLFLAVLAAINR